MNHRKTPVYVPPARRRRPPALVQLYAVFRKEVRQTVRDRRVMFMLIFAPLLQTIVFGFAIDFDVDRVPTVLVDLDGSAESRLHARRLLADGTLRQSELATSAEQGESALDAWHAAAAVVLPRGLERDLLAGRPAEVQVVLDGTDPNRAAVAASAVSRYFGEVGQKLAQDKLRTRGFRPPPAMPLSPRIAYNPSLRSAPFMVPGVTGMLLLIVTTIVTAMGMSRERETGTLEQVLVTPIRPLVLLVGKMAPFFIIGILDVGLVLVAGVTIFGVPVRGGLDVLFVATCLYLLSTLGVGLLISTVSSNQQQSFLGGFLFTMPAILLSGVMTPIRAMPEWLADITLLNPVRYFVEAIRAILLKGAGFEELSGCLLALGVFGTVILTLAALRFRKRLT
jgi:ABC-2 type transport system permease protein